MLRHGFHAKVEAFKAARPEQRQVAWLAEDHFVRRFSIRYVHDGASRPTFENGAVRLAKVPDRIALNAKRFEHARGHPGKFGSRVHQNGSEPVKGAGLCRILDLDVNSER